MSKGGSKLLRSHAEKIAKKLDAKIKNGGDHIVASFYYEDTLIYTFGIRHSRKVPHGYIPKQMHISERVAVEMAACTVSKAEYVELLMQKGVIERPTPPNEGHATD